MHISDALLSSAVGGAFWAGSLGVIAFCSKKMKENPDERAVSKSDRGEVMGTSR